MKTSAKVALAGLGGAVVGALIWSFRSRFAVKQPPYINPAAEQALLDAELAIRKGEPFPTEQYWRDALEAISRGDPLTNWLPLVDRETSHSIEERSKPRGHYG